MDSSAPSCSAVIHYTQAIASGSGRYVKELVQSLAALGLDVHMVCPADNEHVPSLSGTQGVHVHTICPWVQDGKASLRGMLKSTVHAVATLRRLKPTSNIVHVNFPGIDFLAVPAVMALRMRGFRVILTVHDPVPHRWIVPSRLIWLQRLAIHWLYRAAHTLIVHDQGGRGLLVTEFGVDPDRVRVVPHGAYPLAHGPVAFPGGGDCVALAFGSPRSNKGVHLAIAAVQELRQAGYPLRLVIAGGASSAEPDYWHRCKDMVSQAPDGIEILDRFIADTELADLISRAHFFVLPYAPSFHSQSGVATLALSNGRCVVSTLAGGLRDVAERVGRAHIEIGEATVCSVKSALAQATLLGPEALAELGAEGRSLFLKSFAWDAIAREYREIYSESGQQ